MRTGFSLFLLSLRAAARSVAVLAVLAWLAVLPRANAQITSSAQLNGAGYFDMPSLPAMGRVFTVEAWVNPKSLSGYGRIVDLGNPGYPNDNILLMYADGSATKPVFWVFYGSNQQFFQVTAPSPIPLNTWSHIAGSIASDGTMKVFVNGKEVASGKAPAAAFNVPRTACRVGGNHDGPAFNGSIADVRIWTTDRTESDIQGSLAVGSITGAATGLVAAYPFGATGAAPLADVSGNNRTLTQSGTVQFNASGSTVQGGRLAANTSSVLLGGSGYLEIGTPPSISGSITLEGWVRPRSHANWARMIDYGRASGDTIALSSSFNTSGRPSFYMEVAGATVLNVVAPDAIPLNAWTHVAGVLNSDKTAQLYINGRLVASGTSSAAFSTGSPVTALVGKSRNSWDVLIDASLADVRVWNSARTAAQVQAAMPVGSITGATSGLVAAYPFGATGADSLADVSGNNRTLTSSGTVQFNALGPSSPTVSSGNNAITAALNGSGWYAMPTLPSLGTAVTVEAWVNVKSHKTWHRPIELGNSPDGDIITLVASEESSGKPLLTFQNGNSWATSISGPSALPLNTWTHLAGVIGSDNSMRLYVNGQLVTSRTEGFGLRAVSRSANFIGNSRYNNPFDGSIADVRIWSVARSQSDIQASMPVGSISGAVTGLVAAYPLGSTESGVLNDVSGNSRTLTQTGAVAYEKVGSGSVRTASIAGASSLTVSSGQLTLDSVNSYTGGTFVNAGTLGLASGGESGALRGTVTVQSAGTLRLTSQNAMGWAGGSKVDALVVNGGLVETTAAGDNGWGVAYRMTGGELRANGGVSSTTSPSWFSLGGGSTLSTFASSSSAVVSGRLLLREGNVDDTMSFDVADGPANIDLLVSAAMTPLSTSGKIRKTGAGLMVLSGNNTYAGGTTVGAGILQVGDGGTSGTLGSGNVVNNATLVLNRSDDIALGVNLSGSGTLVQRGPGTLTISGSVAPAGGTLITGGAVRLVEIRRLSGVVTVESGAVLRVDGWDSLGYDSDPPYVTSVTVNGGTVVMGGGPNQSASTDFVLNGGRITGPMNWNLYSATPANNTASVTTTASATTSVIDASTMSFGQQAVTFDVADGAASPDLAVSTVASGAGGLVKSGAGLMVLTGNNTYSGTTTISAGTLQVGDGGTSGTLGTGNVVNNATLAFNRSDALAVANLISGTGVLVQSGSGTITLSGANTYSGATTVGAGTLALSGSGTLGTSSTITVTGGAMLDVTGRSSVMSLASSQTLASSGGTALLAGNLNAEAGTLSVTSDGTTPGFTVSGGTLTVGAGTLLRLNKTGAALGAGTYKVIAKGTGGAVAASAPGVVQVDGAGLASGMTASAEISGGELFVNVAALQMGSASNNDNVMAAALNGSGWFAMPSLPTMGSTVTVEGWVFPRSFASWARVVDLGNGTANNNIILVPSALTSGVPNLSIYTGGSASLSLSASRALPLNTWSHLAGVINADRSCQLYVNGQLVASGTASALPPSVERASNFIGKSNWSNDPILDGSIADVRIWSVARTQMQIQSAMTVGSVNGPATGLVAAYPFGATGAGVLSDVSGNARHLVQTRGVTYQKSGAGTLTNTLSIVGSFRYYRFVPTVLRGGTSADAVQLAEFQMLLDGNPLSGATASNPGGDNSGTTPQQANDNNLATKWFDRTKTNPLILDFGTPIAATSYRFATAEDVPNRDPISWRVEGSLNGTTWDTLDTQANYATTSSRTTYTPVLALTTGSIASGLTVSGGTLGLTGAHSMVGGTLVEAGALALAANASLSRSTTITIAGGAKLDVSSRSSALILGGTQTLASSGTGALLSGSFNVESATLAPSVVGASPSFVISGGTMIVGSGTTLRVRNPGTALAVGTYRLVGKGEGGSVAGTRPASATVTEGGIASGTVAIPVVADGELSLRVLVPTPTTFTISGLSQSYDGTPRAVTAGSSPTNVAYRVTYNGSPTPPVNAGSYAVVVTSADPEYTGTANGTLVVGKGTALIKLGNLFQNYDGTPRKAVAVTTPSGLPWSVTYNGSSIAPTNMGLYTVVATINHGNYMGTATGTLAVRQSNPGNLPPATPRPPSYLNHQGFLADAQGVPLGSPNPRTYDILFRVYSAPVGGASLWTERQVVTVDQGRYSVMLGEGQSFGIEPWPSIETVLGSGAGAERYIQVTVRGIGLGGSDIVMMPRYQFVSSPYVFLSNHATTTDTLVDSNGIPVVRVSGNSVGVSVEQPNAGLDVGGILTATSLATPGNAKLGGVLTASAFIGPGTLPLGAIVVWAGNDPPQGWALCDGRTVNARKTPDLRGRFVLGHGSGAGLTPRVLGQIGGAESHALGQGQIPRHSHMFDPPFTPTSHAGQHEHEYQSHSVTRGTTPLRWLYDWLPNDWLQANEATKQSWTTGSVNHSPHRHSIALAWISDAAGSGQPHTSMPPFYVLAYIMRVQ